MNRVALEALYADLAPALAGLNEPWCVIGSAAMLIAGAPVADCPDLDIMTTERGAEALEAAWEARRDRAYAPGGAELFRSRFSTYDFPAGRVEVMGDLLLLREGAWERVAMPSAVVEVFAGAAVNVPTRQGQIDLFRLFGRPKDLAKARLLGV